ncbi:MAG: transglycosylase domain-containing protein [Bacillaceae bacterium]
MKRAIPYIRAFIFISLFVFLVYVSISFIVSTIFKVAGIPPINIGETTIIYSDDGEPLSHQYEDENRHWVPLKDIQPALIDATLATEDQHFYGHHGFDYIRIGGAIVADIKAMSKVQGASTITQQLARNLYLEHEKTWTRKIKEALYTIRLEQNLSKKEILENYLNTIYYGFRAYGIEAASQTYFGKEVKQLTIAESALLAGIPKNPSIFSPFIDEKSAIQRQQLILRQMYDQKRITKKQYKEALAEPLTFAKNEKKEEDTLGLYFIDTVKAHLKTEAHLSTKQILQGGLRVYTTLNKQIQKNIEVALQETIPATSTIEGAVLVQNPKTGEVKGLAGGKDYNKTQFNRITQAMRQPGSTMKPLLYYTALENGFTPSTSLKSEKTNLKIDDDGDKYAPNNASRTYANRNITMLEALALSDNIYATKTLQAIGEKSFVQTAKSFHLQTELEAVPSLALGTSLVKPIELMNAYSILANKGKETIPAFITRIEDRNGTVLYERKEPTKQIAKKESTFILGDLMKGMFEKNLTSYTNVTGADIADEITHSYSGKSGSTNTDSWMIGFTNDLLTGVWIGYDDNQHLKNIQEYRYAKQIWLAVMEKSLQQQKEEQVSIPKGVVSVVIDPHSGKKASQACSLTRTVYYKKGTEPTEVCTTHSSKPKNKETKKMPTKKSWIGNFFH